MSDITVCIPTLRHRAHLLRRALRSVEAQTLSPAEVIVVEDTEWRGASYARNQALERVQTPLVAFLDDDDEFRPHHLEFLADAQQYSGADLVYPWFDVIGGVDPLGAFGRPFNPRSLRVANYIPITVLTKTESVLAAGGFQNMHATGATHEDWNCWLSMLDNGCTFFHLPARTWLWHHHDGNTGGRERLSRLESEGIRAAALRQ